MGLVSQAQEDIRDITTDLEGWGVDITVKTPDGLTTLDCQGLHTKHHMSYDTEGNLVSTRNAHASISEGVFIDAGYPYRNAKGDVYLNKHRIVVADSTGVAKEYVISDAMPDETIGLIVIILRDYEPNT